MNELFLVFTIILYFGMPIIFKRYFGRIGLYCWTILGMVFANIELLKLVDIFGFNMTLGNVLFSSTFLTTDILSENYGKQEAQLAVRLGIISNILMIIISQIMLVFEPASNDTVQACMLKIFAHIPRICVASLFVYWVCQNFDVWLYHKIWDWTIEKYHDKNKALWIRNNIATFVSQLINNLLFSVIAWFNTYDTQTISSIIISSTLLSWILALLDTPFVYLSKYIKEKSNEIQNN